jgi:hypothetical protein
MAAPNIVDTATMTLEVVGGALTTSAATIVNNAASSNTAIKIVSLYVSNVDGTNAADVTINYYTLDDIGGTAYAIAKTVSVPADSTIVIIDQNSPVYLEEDNSLGGLASANSDLEYVCSYQIINDA